ncbi:Membrane protease subunit, stomatin/prohibitin family, contains C-terminal Zn-ribbon domain [Fontibacillus panacisegetis]|uniref:Membrane protease subunit, stomatin/prohibitin family, contains C-terminal Zn-ribbon domain n=1 Tax=Fontibacillus panacisegetis TaxID=670482 RepID=A0A1G7KQR8_9BACL|nr:SPFH domain-containing protein [Fontibacillus panacisegetis]SDF39300.1 Membrane protease subunit, stomatin/prohibitin family, contains C-terminal Zn-ribbon domain [Fontibacillus panacisegetis]
MAIIDVIKYDGSPDVFAWKHPENELGTWTQLIVNQSQEAILFKDGKALDLYGAGRHALSTPNIPILNNLINLPFGGDSPFAAEVWYVNKISALDIKWGTASPIQLQDPKYNIIVPVRAYGQFGIQIEDSRKFLLKLVGTLPVFDQERLAEYFRGLIRMNINSMLTSYLVHKKISVLEINAFIPEMSKHFEQLIAPEFEEYGIKILNLYIHNVNLPEDDQSVKRLREALARKAEMDIIGYNYQQERTFDTLEGAAKNEGSAQAGTMGAGLGFAMAYGMGGTFASEMSQFSKVMNTNGTTQSLICTNCQHENPAASIFCSRCGGSLAEPPKVTPPTAKLVACNSCGSPLQPGSKFCANCGDKYHSCPKCGADNAEDSQVCVVCKEALPRQCPKCGQQVMGDTKFCGNCGEDLVQKCKNCGHEVKPNQKFCLECGSNLLEGSAK